MPRRPAIDRKLGADQGFPIGKENDQAARAIAARSDALLGGDPPEPPLAHYPLSGACGCAEAAVRAAAKCAIGGCVPPLGCAS